MKEKTLNLTEAEIKEIWRFASLSAYKRGYYDALEGLHENPNPHLPKFFRTILDMAYEKQEDTK